MGQRQFQDKLTNIFELNEIKKHENGMQQKQL